MTERSILRTAILVFWTLFWGLSVVDKVIPDVQFLWVGKDFFALFIKFFASLGLKDPLFATSALAGVSALEAINFALYLTALLSLRKGDEALTDAWFFRAILSSAVLFSLFSIADQVFGDRFQLLEHGLFWLVLIASWMAFKHAPPTESGSVSWLPTSTGRRVLIAGSFLTGLTAASIWNFSEATFGQASEPVTGEEVVEGVYKFDFPFLADKRVWETTVNTFMADHPELKVRYIYTGPSELNTKKKTHLLLYVFTEAQ
jgi:signal transduction histidine kinase